jgi:rod shape-determining protein RodA
MLAQIWHGRLGGLRLIMLLAVAMLLTIGLACIYATGKTIAFNKQLYFIGAGIAAFIAVNLFHYRRLGQLSYAIYGACLLLLIFVLLGKYMQWGILVNPRGGSYRWITIPHLPQFQPSELAKLAYILALAWYLQHRKNYRTIKGLIGPFAMALVPMALILKEPDLGTAMLFVPILFLVLFTAGAKWRHLLTIILAGVLLAPVFYLTLGDYQKDRVKGMIYQDSKDPYWQRGPGYQLRQSKMCIGLGRLTGQGWGKGLYIQYGNFLPERHNDFIFALIGHQWGLLGEIIVLGLYGVIIICGIEIASNQIDPFGRLLAVGIISLLTAQVFINVGMTIGLMPVTGMTLPFVSYGGSSLLCSFIALGLLMNIARRRPHQIARRSFEFDS